MTRRSLSKSLSYVAVVRALVKGSRSMERKAGRRLEPSRYSKVSPPFTLGQRGFGFHGRRSKPGRSWR